MNANADPPSLDCPECGEASVAAIGRGYYDDEGDFVAHRDECRCLCCDWVWSECSDNVVCVCGASLYVAVDEYPYVKAISEESDDV